MTVTANDGPWAMIRQAKLIEQMAHWRAAGILPRYRVRIPRHWWSLSELRSWQMFQPRFGRKRRTSKRKCLAFDLLMRRGGPVGWNKREPQPRGLIRHENLRPLSAFELRVINAQHRTLGIEEVLPNPPKVK